MATETKNTTKKAKAEPKQKAPQKVEYVVNVARGLNMRTKPNGEVLRVLPAGHIVTGDAYEAMPVWVEVRDGKQTGWVMSEYLTKVEGGEADA